MDYYMQIQCKNTILWRPDTHYVIDDEFSAS